MTREEIRNKVLELLKTQVGLIQAEPYKLQQFQLSRIYALFPPEQNVPNWQIEQIHSIAREIIQELENSGFIYDGTPTLGSGMSSYPFYTITEYGKEALLQEDWLPYDPDGYLKALKTKVPDIDDITLTYIGEAVAAYNRRHLLSATITLGVASENLMLTLIETYADWIPDPVRKQNFQNRIEGKFISKQYKEFKQEFLIDVRTLSKDIQANWETYLDGIFNFIRLNRNDAGHPTGKQFDAKIVYANLQVFSEYSQFILRLQSELI
jgi:hypothetical protein